MGSKKGTNTGDKITKIEKNKRKNNYIAPLTRATKKNRRREANHHQ
jgi:hypothetical protein